jgi:hypothetical protein
MIIWIKAFLTALSTSTELAHPKFARQRVDKFFAVEY